METNKTAHEIIRTKKFLTELDQLKYMKPNLQVDNEIIIRFAQNPELHKRTN